MEWDFIPHRRLFNNKFGADTARELFRWKSDGTYEVLGGRRYRARHRAGHANSSRLEYQLNSQPLITSRHACAAARGHDASGRMPVQRDRHRPHLPRHRLGLADLERQTGSVRKPADETVNASVTLQNDNHLFWPVEANEIWQFEGMLRAQAVNATPDWKFKLAVPAGATAEWDVGATTGGWNQTGVGTTANLLKPETAVPVVGSGLGTQGIYFAGWVFAAATAGTVTLQWAQNTPTVDRQQDPDELDAAPEAAAMTLTVEKRRHVLGHAHGRSHRSGGPLGVRIEKLDGTDVFARTTTGIVEDLARASTRKPIWWRRCRPATTW